MATSSSSSPSGGMMMARLVINGGLHGRSLLPLSIADAMPCPERWGRGVGCGCPGGPPPLSLADGIEPLLFPGVTRPCRMGAAVLRARGDGLGDDLPLVVGHPPPPEFPQLGHGGIVLFLLAGLRPSESLSLSEKMPRRTASDSISWVRRENFLSSSGVKPAISKSSPFHSI